MAQRPNILLILTDQHNPHIAGYAGNPWVETPALDGLAVQAANFTAAYCQSPLCVPARYALWTGKLVHRCRAWDNTAILSRQHITLPGWLAQHGYATAAVGKMHFRGVEQMYGWQYRPFGDLVESAVSHHQPDPPDTADGRSFNHAIGRFPFAGPTAIPESLLADEVVTTEIPLLVRSPGQQKRQTIGLPVEHVDLFPTFCDWAGIPSPSDLDGESLVSLLDGQPEQRKKRIARSALLGERLINRFRMARDARWKYVDFPSASPRLFDLLNDPGETHDLLPHAPADAPIDELRQLATAGGSWEEIAAAQAADKQQAPPIVKIGRGANQYRLGDGRVVDADDHLYAPTIGAS